MLTKTCPRLATDDIAHHQQSTRSSMIGPGRDQHHLLDIADQYRLSLVAIVCRRLSERPDLMDTGELSFPVRKFIAGNSCIRLVDYLPSPFCGHTASTG